MIALVVMIFVGEYFLSIDKLVRKLKILFHSLFSHGNVYENHEKEETSIIFNDPMRFMEHFISLFEKRIFLLFIFNYLMVTQACKNNF